MTKKRQQADFKGEANFQKYFLDLNLNKAACIMLILQQKRMLLLPPKNQN
ncbi:MAG: hypothetical protein V5804_05670 [Mucilaginibacter sp.]